MLQGVLPCCCFIRAVLSMRIDIWHWWLFDATAPALRPVAFFGVKNIKTNVGHWRQMAQIRGTKGEKGRKGWGLLRIVKAMASCSCYPALTAKLQISSHRHLRGGSLELSPVRHPGVYPSPCCSVVKCNGLFPFVLRSKMFQTPGPLSQLELSILYDLMTNFYRIISYHRSHHKFPYSS